MWPYIAVALLLGVTVVLNVYRHSPSIRYGCLIIIIVFVGLRYQLGYDWVGYERLFDFVPDNFDLTQYGISRFVLRTEPLYYFSNVFTKSLGGSFELLLFLMATFNIIVIDKMCEEIMPESQPFVWLVYFCAAMIAIQFNIIRQAVAASFIILSLIMYLKNRIYLSIILFVVGSLIQVSVLMFMPIYLSRILRPRWTVILGIIGASALLWSSDIFIGGDMISTAGSLLPEFIGSKADNYIDAFSNGSGFSTISPLAVVLMIGYCSMLFEFMHFRDDPVIRVSIYLTVLILFAHTALGTFPSVWNRIMCVSLPWQLACLWRTGIFHQMEFAKRIGILASIAAVGTAVLAYQLSRPESAPFVPYHSLIQVWAGDYGNGRAKAEDAIRIAQSAPVR